MEILKKVVDDHTIYFNNTMDRLIKDIAYRFKDYT